MIAAIFIGLIAVAALAFVMQPLRAGPRRAGGDDTSLVDDAVAKKRSALVAIVDMENENAAGKLSDADLAALRTRYEVEALDALRELDALSAGDDDEALEAEIAEMRARLSCPNCGELRTPGGHCPACGA